MHRSSLMRLAVLAVLAWTALGSVPALAGDPPAPASTATVMIEAPASRTADPYGASTGMAYDVKTGETSVMDIANAVGHNKVAINMVWMLITGFLVMFMQAGFAMVEAGFTRAKNVAHTMAMNFMIYPLGMLGFYVCGFALMFGGVGALGHAGRLRRARTASSPSASSARTSACSARRASSSAAESTTSPSSPCSSSRWSSWTRRRPSPPAPWPSAGSTRPSSSTGSSSAPIIYPIYGNWVWGGGWLATLGKNFGLGHGHVDFAGSSVVHMTGGVLALVGAMIIGPRIGKYNKDGSANAIPGHNIPMAIIGTFILAFGWFGFNPGSTLAGTDLASPWWRSTPCSPRPPAPSPRRSTCGGSRRRSPIPA